MVSAVLLAVGGTACGDSPPVVTATPSTFFTSSTSSTSSTSIAASAGLGFSDRDNGRSATVAAGQRITVILHSSDFVFAPASDVSVLREDGPPTVTPGRPTCTDAVAGCGTVVANFVAVGAGDATIAADRTGCVEPGCPPAAAHWQLTVQVAGEAPTSTSPTPTDPPAASEVRGTVHFSPVCPVEQIPPDPECAPRPGPADIELIGPDGTVAASTPAGEDGAFTIPVAPGSYAVRATAAPGTALGGACQTDPPEFTVDPAMSITVSVSCDTGIR
jgi:hypothetical protein